MLYHAHAMTHPYLEVLSIDHIKLTLAGIRSINDSLRTPHERQPYMLNRLRMLYRAYAMTQKYRIARRIASR